MAIIALDISWKQGDVPLNPGGIVNRPANYGNLGSFAKWRRRFLSGVSPVSPNPHNPTYNVLAPGAFHMTRQGNPGGLAQSVSNVQGVVEFTPAAPSANNATNTANAALSANAAATKGLL